MDRFVPAIEAGDKRHTIRAEREIPIQVGDWLHLYARPRQKGMRLIFRAPCVRVEPIRIEMDNSWEKDRQYMTSTPDEIAIAYVAEARLSMAEFENLALADGFPGGWKQMMLFWRDRLPFAGEIIHWDYDRRQMEMPKK